MDRKIISIKVDSDEDEDRILDFLKKWCVENFQNPAEISVAGKKKTAYFQILKK